MRMDKNFSRSNKILTIMKTTGILIFPVVFYFIPSEIIESQKTICIFKNILNNECIGCGITRAVYWTLHFEFEKAYKLNKFIVIIFPLLAFIWLKILNSITKRHIAQ